MSPAGVPMFYGAEEFHTAVQEVVGLGDNDLKGQIAAGVQFKTIIDLNMLDLTAPSLRRSYFRNEHCDHRESIEFLRDFAEEFSKPIGRGDREHIDYVPTQVFTEFVRYIMRSPNGSQIHGVKYLSSWTERPCYVIFANQDQCLPLPELSNEQRHKPKPRQLLEFVPASLKTEEIQ